MLGAKLLHLVMHLNLQNNQFSSGDFHVLLKLYFGRGNDTPLLPLFLFLCGM